MTWSVRRDSSCGGSTSGAVLATPRGLAGVGRACRDIATAGSVAARSAAAVITLRAHHRQLGAWRGLARLHRASGAQPAARRPAQTSGSGAAAAVRAIPAGWPAPVPDACVTGADTASVRDCRGIRRVACAARCRPPTTPGRSDGPCSAAQMHRAAPHDAARSR